MVMTTWGKVISHFDFSIVDYTGITESQASNRVLHGHKGLMNSKLTIRSLYSPRHPDTRGKCCLKLTDLVHCPPLLFTMMLRCHMTRFWPPDWLLLCTSSIPRCLEGQSFQLVSRERSQWQRKLCEYIFQFLSCNKGMIPLGLHAS